MKRETFVTRRPQARPDYCLDEEMKICKERRKRIV